MKAHSLLIAVAVVSTLALLAFAQDWRVAAAPAVLMALAALVKALGSATQE